MLERWPLTIQINSTFELQRGVGRDHCTRAALAHSRWAGEPGLAADIEMPVIGATKQVKEMIARARSAAPGLIAVLRLLAKDRGRPIQLVNAVEGTDECRGSRRTEVGVI